MELILIVAADEHDPCSSQDNRGGASSPSPILMDRVAVGPLRSPAPSREEAPVVPPRPSTADAPRRNSHHLITLRLHFSLGRGAPKWSNSCKLTHLPDRGKAQEHIPNRFRNSDFRHRRLFLFVAISGFKILLCNLLFSKLLASRDVVSQNPPEERCQHGEDHGKVSGAFGVARASFGVHRRLR